MKMKRIGLVRPEVELTVRTVRGWMLVPFFMLYAYLKCIRILRKAVVINFGEEIYPAGYIYVLSIPKITVNRDDAM